MAEENQGAAKTQNECGFLNHLKSEDIVAIGIDTYATTNLHNRVYHLSLSPESSVPENLQGLDGDESSAFARKVGKNADVVRIRIPPNKLGCGGFGSVFKCTMTQKKKEEKDICLKLSLQWDERDKPDREVNRHIVREIQNLLLLKDNPHENIIQFLFACSTSGANSRVCIGIEYFPGKDLNKIIRKYKAKGKRIPSDHINAIFVGVVSAVKHLQQLDDVMIHCDIKPHNVLFNSSSMKVKLIDFGCAVVYGRTNSAAGPSRMEFGGTSIYMAPEMLDKAKQPHIDSTDVYSIGALMFRLVTFSRPWDDVAEVNEARNYSRHRFCKALIKAMADRTCEPSDNDNPPKYFTKLQMTLKEKNADHCQIYPNHCELICSMLDFNPIERPSCDKILTFIQEKCTCPILRKESRTLISRLVANVEVPNLEASEVSVQHPLLNQFDSTLSGSAAYRPTEAASGVVSEDRRLIAERKGASQTHTHSTHTHSSEHSQHSSGGGKQDDGNQEAAAVPFMSPIMEVRERVPMDVEHEEDTKLVFGMPVNKMEGTFIREPPKIDENVITVDQSISSRLERLEVDTSPQLAQLEDFLYWSDIDEMSEESELDFTAGSTSRQFFYGHHDNTSMSLHGAVLCTTPRRSTPYRVENNIVTNPRSARKRRHTEIDDGDMSTNNEPEGTPLGANNQNIVNRPNDTPQVNSAPPQDHSDNDELNNEMQEPHE